MCPSTSPSIGSLAVRFALLLAATFAGACKEGPIVGSAATGAVEDPPGGEPPTAIGPFDAIEMKAALQGDWIVEKDGRLHFEFSFHGDDAKVVDHRFTTPTTREGRLLLRSATGIGVETADGVGYYYSFVRDGEDVFLGFGAALRAVETEPFTAKLGAWEKLVVDEGGGCRFVRTWGGETAEESVACGFEERDGRKVFHYQSEDPFRRGKMKKNELYVVGSYLLAKELAESKARRRVPGETLPPPTDPPRGEPIEEEAPEPASTPAE